MEELFYQIALTRVEWIGNRMARTLLSHFGSAKAIFDAKTKDLEVIDQIGQKRLKALKSKIDTKRIEKEIMFIEKHKINHLFLKDKDYPNLLKECSDAPILLYFKGNLKAIKKKNIAIVGSRKNTNYGRQVTEEFIEALKNRNDIGIISGLASGIDSIAHKAALKNNISTIGVLGHGLDRIYPAQNKNLAAEMLENGGLLTEYPSETLPDKQNFPQRNRIVAGMADVTVVIESGSRGGSLITAQLACSYNREVAAFPGRSIDRQSAGCNYLIKTNIAQLIQNADDLIELMNWQPEEVEKQAVQGKLFETLDPDEKSIVDILEKNAEIHIDELTLKSKMNDSRLQAILLSLELDGLIRSLPGKRYRLS